MDHVHRLREAQVDCVCDIIDGRLQEVQNDRFRHWLATRMLFEEKDSGVFDSASVAEGLGQGVAARPVY